MNMKKKAQEIAQEMIEKKKAGAMKKGTMFLAGLAVGVYVTQKWRTLAKDGIKLGMQAGQKLNEISQQAREEIEDMTAEAKAELVEQAAQAEQAAKPEPAAKPAPRPARAPKAAKDLDIEPKPDLH